MIPSLYLAYSQEIKQSVRSFEHSLENKLCVGFINPLYDTEERTNPVVIDTGKKVVTIDGERTLLKKLALVQKSDGIISFWDVKDYGVAMTTVYAKIMDKTVYSVTERERKNPWIVFHSRRIFHGFEDLEEFLTKLYGFKGSS